MHFWLILQNQSSESESSSGFLYLFSAYIYSFVRLSLFEIRVQEPFMALTLHYNKNAKKYCLFNGSIRNLWLVHPACIVLPLLRFFLWGLCLFCYHINGLNSALVSMSY